MYSYVLGQALIWTCLCFAVNLQLVENMAHLLGIILCQNLSVTKQYHNVAFLSLKHVFLLLNSFRISTILVKIAHLYDHHIYKGTLIKERVCCISLFIFYLAHHNYFMMGSLLLWACYSCNFVDFFVIACTCINCFTILLITI